MKRKTNIKHLTFLDYKTEKLRIASLKRSLAENIYDDFSVRLIKAMPSIQNCIVRMHVVQFSWLMMKEWVEIALFMHSWVNLPNVFLLAARIVFLNKLSRLVAPLHICQKLFPKLNSFSFCPLRGLFCFRPVAFLLSVVPTSQIQVCLWAQKPAINSSGCFYDQISSASCK